MKRAAALTLALALAAAPASAQMDHDMDHGMDHDAMHAGASLEAVTGLYETVRGYLMATAEQASQELYDYRPTDEVRSFGEILGHVANAGYLFCGNAVGEEPPQVGNAEELGSKAEIVAALRASFEFCDMAHAMDADRAGEAVSFFGQDHTRLSVLAFNMGHDFEHYGNLVTYMRINGMVPPSSQGQQ